MKIDGPNPLRQPQRTGRATRPGGGSGFADALSGLAGAARQSGQVNGAARTGALHALLAVQGFDDNRAERRRQAAARGLDLLDTLEELRRHLLGGAVPRDTLERLTSLAEQSREDIDDPHLAELLDEIDLRAQVELAKLGAWSEPAGDG
jgi:hypothetical protein